MCCRLGSGRSISKQKVPSALEHHGLIGSMGGVASARDNAPLELFFALPQKNVLGVTPFFGPVVMKVVLRPASSGRKAVKIMTKRKKRHSPEQIVQKSQQADRILAEGGDVAAKLRELGITEATYYRWHNHYGGVKAEDAKKLKHLEKQNRKLKKLLAQAGLEKAVLMELAERVF